MLLQFFKYISRVLTQDTFQGRILIVLLVCCCFVALAVLRLYKFQILEGQEWSSRAQALNPEIEPSRPSRGNIYVHDTAGQRNHLVATNKPAFVLGANPQEIESPTSILNNVSSIVEINVDEYNTLLRQLLDKEREFVPIADRLTQGQIQRIQRKNLKGIRVQTSSFRYYPSASLGSHVIGFLGYTNQSKGLVARSGIEKFFDTELAGQKGDALEFVPGVDIVLTLDQTIQFKVEQELSALVERYQAEFATAIFMDPKTGKILAMSNAPSFDANKYGDATILARTNHAVQGRFELGSIFKPLTMAFGIDAGDITPNTTYEDPGVRLIDGYRITNFDGRSHGVNTMTQVLESSLNTGTIFALEEMGSNTFLEYVQRFQLGKKTHIQLPGEVNNNIGNLTGHYVASQYANASFGHGVEFTPLRMLASFAALANNGVVMEPYIVDQIIKENGEIITAEPKEIATPISANTAEQVTEMLMSVVENGYRDRVSVPGYTIAAKTGTAQIARGGFYTSDVRHSFIGFAPASDPQFIGILVLENPQGIQYAVSSLSPVFKGIAEFLFQYYDIPPDK